MLKIFTIDIEPEAFDDIQKKTVSIKAVFCTYQDPEKWEERIK